MKSDKIRNLTDVELRHQERELNDQLFRLKFQLKMGQTESLKKIRGLRKDIARVKTIARERELGNNGAPAPAAVAAEQPKPKAKAESKAKPKKTGTEKR
jgi:large subunit ribosomal protein L29